jgi:hypothetical protein
LKIRGSKLPSDLRVVSHRKEIKVAIEKVSDTEATLVVEVPSDAKSGPFGIWFATASGPLTSKVVLIDELATVIDNGNNHSVATAQSVNTLGAVDGTSDGTKSDHYRFHVEAGQRVAFEVLTQAIHSKMDPMVRLLHPVGRVFDLGIRLRNQAITSCKWGRATILREASIIYGSATSLLFITLFRWQFARERVQRSALPVLMHCRLVPQRSPTTLQRIYLRRILIS